MTARGALETAASVAAVVIIAAWALPASLWLEVRRVIVADAVEGAPVILTVEREIHREFAGEWHVNVRRLDADGMLIACTASGGGKYRPEAKFPEPLTLDWWTSPVKCNLPPGQYVMDTVWTFRAALGMEKAVVASSGRFTIRPR